jgi:hypothetical protein
MFACDKIRWNLPGILVIVLVIAAKFLNRYHDQHIPSEVIKMSTEEKKEQLFRPIGQVVDTAGGEEDEGSTVDEIDSLCMKCHEQVRILDLYGVLIS